MDLNEVNEKNRRELLSELETTNSNLAINPDDRVALVRRKQLLKLLEELDNEETERKRKNELKEHKTVPSPFESKQHNSQEQSVDNKHSESLPTPPKEETDKVLLKMKSDVLIYTLEKRLKTEPDHWQIAKIEFNPIHRSYVSSYCKGQENAFKQILLEADEVICQNYKDELRKISQKIKTRTTMISNLVPQGQSILNTSLTTHTNNLSALNITFVNLSPDEKGMRIAKDHLRKTTNDLIQTLIKIEQKASWYYDN